MIKYSKTIIDNYFGFSLENQKRIYDELYNSIEEDDELIKKSIEVYLNHI